MNGSELKISIITVSYNSAATIADTINSVASQSYSQIEHLVIDGYSTDNTLSVVEDCRHSNLILSSEHDSGIYDAMNKGLSKATGDIVGFLNSDDFYASTDVLQQVSEIFLDPDIDACYADLVYVDKTNASKIVRYWQSRSFEPGLFKRGWMPAHPTFFVRKKVYEKFGIFDLSFPRQADFELTLRFLEVHKICSVYAPRIWVKMRTGGISNSNIISVIKANLESYKACLMHGINVSIFFIPLKIISRIPQYFIRP